MTKRRILLHGCSATLVSFLLALAGPTLWPAIDLRIYDVMLRATAARAPSGRVAIVAVDDRSLTQVGQWPWPRDRIASLLERIRSMGAAVVAVDILLAEPDRFGSAPREPAGPPDTRLAATLREGRVIVSHAFTFDADRPPGPCLLHPFAVAAAGGVARRPADSLFRASGVVCALPELARAAGASGFLNAGPDRDGLLRRVPLLMAYERDVYASLAFAAVARARGARSATMRPLAGGRARLSLGDLDIPLEERGTLLLRFRGGRQTFTHHSAADVLAARLGPDAFRDRIVFVGATALGVRDQVATPVDNVLPGIEVHATAAETLLQRDFLRTSPNARAWELLSTAALGLAAALVVALAGFVSGTALNGVLLAGLWGGVLVIFRSGGVYLSPFSATLAVVLTLVTLIVARMRHERARADAERGRRERAQHFAVQSLTSLVETRDEATGRHARRTEEYTRLLATAMAKLPRYRRTMTEEYVDLVARLAPLHDIGKVGVRDAVLLKPGPLSPEELDEIRQHPAFGHDTIVRAERLAGVGAETIVALAKDIVYTHHERWDGSGYPRGLRGEAIPLAGRIVALVDVYDALMESRTYRPSVAHDDAVAAIAAARGTHFDPDVVDAFLSVQEQFRALAGRGRRAT